MQPVAYVYNNDITSFVFSQDHPMKPMRMRMAHSLIEDYQLTRYMRVFNGRRASPEEICEFHHPDYIEYLKNWVNPDAQSIIKQYAPESFSNKQPESEKFNEMYKINRTFDCPSFDGLYNFCELAVGSSLDAADLIISGEAHTAINWSGGYHHAKKSEASGFCYVNDIVVCILELLKVYPRVLYIDIDVHHGDGVQQAFYHTNRVMTLSLHQYEEEFFPGTGEVQSVGQGVGRYYCANVPLRKGIDDANYVDIFKKVSDIVISSYRPDVIVLQSGADSLSKDRIGNFQLSIRAYGECVKHIKNYNVPMVVLGGGGYTIENVARCWTYQTGVILGQEIDNNIPEVNQFLKYYEEDKYKLHFETRQNTNFNLRKNLDRIVQVIAENMREAQIRPSIAFHYAPKNFMPNSDMDWKIVREDENSLMEDEGVRYISKPS